ncbi:MAG: RDD family protein [Nitrososphaerales archaeon]
MSSETPAASGTPEPSNEIILAKWIDRFFAWLIDFIIVTVAVAGIFSAAAFPLWFETNPDRWFRNMWDGSLHYGVTSLIFFAYWAYFESTRGQSIGKMVCILKLQILLEKLQILEVLYYRVSASHFYFLSM